MCGIFGLVSSPDISKAIQSAQTVRPRGPERSHYVYSDDYFLAFHRLAINGLCPTKDQPYVYSDTIDNKNRSYYVLCNGEIYNAPELYRKYTGNSWSSGMSDTEVIYSVWKTLQYDFAELNRQLNGEYALAILELDSLSKPTKLLLSTDYISVRPLFYYIDFQGNCQYGFSSILAGLNNVSRPQLIKRLPGNTMVSIDILNKSALVEEYSQQPYIIDKALSTIQEEIVVTLENSVKKRLMSDREIGCLLSGGLDSSLTSALVAKYAKEQGIRLHTFSIGLAGSPDCKYAKIVADHIGSIHTEITVTEKEALEVIPEVIRVTETFDITTIRASVWQYMLARYISKHCPNIKVVVAGEGSDELLGYVYLKAAPNAEAFQKETEKLTHNIHLFDGIRADRCISHFGLEVRFPFLDEDFCRLVLSIPPEVKMHINGRCEKWVLREAFSQLMSTLLPQEILWRPKAAMSDATSSMERSWFSIVQEHIADLSISQKTLLEAVSHMLPPTEEATYYRCQWQSHFPEAASHVIPYYWLPNQKWCPDAKDPSARTLSFYHGERD